MDHNDYCGVLGLTGLAKSGKGVASAELVQSGWKCVKMAFALKSMLKAMYLAAGLDENTIERKIEGDLKEIPCDILGGKTPRYAMQSLGTEWGRKLIDQDLWANIAETQIIEHLSEGFNVVVDDIRMENEVGAVQGCGGIIAKIDRERAGISGNHSSENGCSFDMKIENNGTVEAFLEKIRHIFIKK